MNRFAVMFVAAVLGSVLAGSAIAQGQPPLPKRYIAGRVLVQPRPGLSIADFDKILKAHGGHRAQVIKQINVHIVELPPEANAAAVAQALRKNRNLKFAEVDGQLEPAFYPNDPYYSNEWHLPKIGSSTAWDYAQGAGVTIAILDTGVDATHPDLQAQLVPGWNFFDNNDDTSDVYGHGTAVAGTAAAAANNGAGVAAVSFQSKIMPMRVTDPNGYGYYSMMAAALTAAADSGARVANISFLGVSLSATVDSAAQYMRSKGGVVVTAGGNTGSLRTEPKSDSLTVVSATDSTDAKASFSSWGDYIDIAAPGVGILTTTKGGGYGNFSGTSAASPVVAGVYALLMSANPDLSPATLDDIVFSTADDLGNPGWDQEFGYGRVDAAAAISQVTQTSPSDTQPPTVAISSPGDGQTVSGLVPVDVTAGDNIGVARVELYANGTLYATDTTGPYGFSLDATKYSDGSLPLEARAYDAAGNSTASSTVTVTVANDTTPPTVQITNPSNGATVSGTVNVSVSASDDKKMSKIVLIIDGREVANSYGSTLSYNWTVPSSTTTKTKGGNGKGNGGGGKGKGKKSTSTASTGSSTIVAQAFDAAGNSKSTSVTVYY